MESFVNRRETKNTTAQIPIPPQSVVRLVRSNRATQRWRKQLERIFRVGYYSRKDGLHSIWLVNDEGQYEQTTAHEFLYRCFDVIHFAKDSRSLLEILEEHGPVV
jgi:hypothetical protein